MENNKVSCKDVMSHICDNLGEELNSPRCMEIKSHLDCCETCQKYFRNVETTIEFYRKYNVTLPEASHAKLLSFLGLEE